MRADNDRNGSVSWQELKDAARHRFGSPSAVLDSLPNQRAEDDF
jgi:hypothetical protein